jgi:hypothetical protein
VTRVRSDRVAKLIAVPATVGLALGLASCGGSDPEVALSVSDAWVKASDGEMTAAFGVVTNEGDADVVVVGAETSASDRTELHEVVMSDGEMVMQPKEDGFAVPAGGEHVLEPGGDHVMIMDLTEPVLPGDDVTVTLKLNDGSTYEYVAQAKETESGTEPYDATSMDMSGTDETGMDETGME